MAASGAACSSDAPAASGSKPTTSATSGPKASASGPADAASTAAPAASAAPAGPFSPPKLDTFKACEPAGGEKEVAMLGALGTLARKAVEAYEREMPEAAAAPGELHRLCASATNVPKDVPKSPYTISTDSGRDFGTGDASSGWKCLGFLSANPVEYQYGYRAHSGFIGPAAGLPDPGPTGFEASARADLDGDGTASTYVMIGWLNPETKQVTLASSSYCSNPGE